MLLIFSVSSGGKTEKGASNTFQAYQASVSDAWDIEVSTEQNYSFIWSEVFSLKTKGLSVILETNVKVILAFDSFANDQI